MQNSKHLPHRHLLADINLLRVAMKCLFVLAFSFQFSETGKAQNVIDRKFHSKYREDSISYSVWLPAEWSSGQKYTSIYTFSYGASDADFVAREIHYLRKLNILNLPPIVVVNVMADLDGIGFNYETGLLTATGTNMVECLKKEIIPDVEARFGTSAFRIYLGQSYAATYGNYLFLHQPELFTGFILMSPEKLAPSQPPFEITPNLVDFYGNRSLYYFVASGGLDMERRQDYALEIAEKVKLLGNTNFYFRHASLREAGHNDSLAIGLPLALGFIYQNYASVLQNDDRRPLSSLIKEYDKKVHDSYGISPDKSAFATYQPYLARVWQRMDTNGMLDAIDYFLGDRSSGHQLRDFAYSCSIVGLTNASRRLYQGGIKKILADEMSMDSGPSSLITCYRELAVLEVDPGTGWELLQKALKVCLKYRSSIYVGYYPDIYFYLGRFSADNNFRVHDGLGYLLLYAEKRRNLVNLVHFDFDEIFYEIGKCYFLLHDEGNARLYLKKALDQNVDNQKAKDLLQRILTEKSR